MRRLLTPLLLLAAVPRLAAQLPAITVPRGAIRIELGGSFSPSDHEYADGKLRPVAGPLTDVVLDAGTTPLVGDLERRLSIILGRPAARGNLGHLSVLAADDHNVGVLGLAIGLTRRITLFGNLPIHYLRTRSTSTYDPTGASFGVNPADPDLGTSLGATQTQGFFGQFDAALADLAKKVADGDFSGAPDREALAKQTLRDAPAFRDTLATLFITPGLASAILPLRNSADGTALLGRVTSFEQMMSSEFGITGFNGTPALPTTALTEDQFQALLTAPSGYALLPFDQAPRTTLGDMETGASYQIVAHGDEGAGRWFGAWATGTIRWRTGTLARPQVLLDQAAGDRQVDLEFGGTVDAGQGRLGIRAQGAYTVQTGWQRNARLGTRDQLLLPASRLAAVVWNPGEALTLSVQPTIRLAPHLAIAAGLTYWSKGADRWTYLTGQQPLEGVDLEAMSTGTAANATRWSVGLSYADNSPGRSGNSGLPVEAGFSIERMLSSGKGVVPQSFTTRVYFRVYRPLFRR